MGMHAVNISTGPMTVDEFYAYIDAEPRGGKWELVGGKPVLNAAPSEIHAQIVSNLDYALSHRQRQSQAPWRGLPGIGVRVSGHERLEPDLAVVPGAPRRTRDRDDVVVVFEVLSPSTEKDDLGPKRMAYTGLAAVTHYVVIAQDAVNVAVFARENGFRKRVFKSPDDLIQFSSLGVSLRVAEVYYSTGLLR